MDCSARSHAARFRGELAALALLAVGALVAAPTGARPQASSPPAPRNVLLVLADDIGVDVLRAYGEGRASYPNTPTIEALASQGVLFRNAWSNPSCSPTRATIQTGRSGFRTGVGAITSSTTPFVLELEEITIPEALEIATPGAHRSGAFGKWHLGNCLNGGRKGPNLAGYDRFAGSRTNLKSYFEWEKIVDGEAAPSTAYATTDAVDSAIAWLRERDRSPWFLYLAFHAPHSPFEVPPHHLVSPDTLSQLRDPAGRPLPAGTSCKGKRRECYLAMVEAMDAELARLLAALSPEARARTTILFVGDNGTHQQFIRPPFARRGKSTLYEDGINVPMIASGAGVERPGRESAGLVNTTDLFATAIELASGRAVGDVLPARVAFDSISLVPALTGRDSTARRFAYAESFDPDRPDRTHGRAIRGERFKLIRFFEDDREELYDLIEDPTETSPLPLGSLTPAQQAGLAALRAELERLVASTREACPRERSCTACEASCSAGANECETRDTEMQFCRRPDGGSGSLRPVLGISTSRRVCSLGAPRHPVPGGRSWERRCGTGSAISSSTRVGRSSCTAAGG